MDRAQAVALQPIEGETVRESLFSMLVLFLGGLLAVPIGAFLTWAWWTEQSLIGFRFTAWVGIVGSLAVLAGLAFIGLPFMAFMTGRTSVVIGSDRIQTLVGDTRVTAQVPYSNLASVELTRNNADMKCVGIDLKDLNDANTWCPKAERDKKWAGFHFPIYLASKELPTEEDLFAHTPEGGTRVT